MQKQVLIENNVYKDVVPIFAGYETCQSSHKFGPHAREYYIIHFCIKKVNRNIEKNN